MDKLDFLDGQPPAEPTTAATEAPAATPEPTQDAAQAGESLPRDDKGRFAAKAATEVAPAPAEASPQAPAIPPEAVQTATVEPTVDPQIAELRRQVAGLTKALTATRKEAAAPPPDPFEDFEAYQVYEAQQRAAERGDWSYRLAVATHGQELADQVKDWAAARYDQDQIFAQRAASSQDPFGFAVGEYQREQALSVLTDPKTLQQFQAWQASLGQAQPAAPAPAPAAPTKPVAPPPSIAQAPSAGGVQHVPQGPGQAYGAIFG